MSLTLTYAPTSGYTVPVYPVYNDQTHLFTSNNSNKLNYKGFFDIYIDGVFTTTIIGYPFNNIIEANPQLTKNYIDHNFYPDLVGCVDNPDSIKRIGITTNEGYSRKRRYSGTTYSSSTTYNYLALLAEDTGDLMVNDRIYIIPDNPLVNPHYNTFAKVVNIVGNTVYTDIYYSAASITETGYYYEGKEFFDYGYVGGNVVVTTSTPHKFKAGDNIVLQMDTYAVGIIQVISGTFGQFTNIYVSGTDILSAPVPFNTDIPTTLDDLVANINTNEAVPQYTAYHYAGDDRLFVYSRREQGDTANGNMFAIFTTGDIGFVFTDFFKDDRLDNITNTGWNPRYSNTYVVTSAVTSTTFQINLIGGYNNPPGSQRGSIYSLSDYYFTGSSLNDYWVMNNCNKYDYIDYESEIATHNAVSSTSKFLTIKPRNKFKYYSLNDIETIDILVKPDDAQTYGHWINKIQVTTYSGDTTGDTYNIALDVSGFSASTDWERITYGVGPFNLNNVNVSDINPTPPTTLINENVTNYDIKLLSLSDNQESEKISFTRECTFNKYFEIIFLNRFGSFDYAYLTANYQQRTAVERAIFQKKRERVISQDNYGIKPIYRGNTVYNVNPTQKIKFYTDWISLEESRWMEEILTSPEVYIYCPDDGNTNTIDIKSFYPIIITDSEVTHPNERSGLIRLEFNVELANNKISQDN